MQVRFISVNDNYDSKNNENGISSLEIPFKNLVYDYYSKDISQKIRSSVKIRQDKGYYFVSKAPYGYMKKTCWSLCGKWRILPNTTTKKEKEIF